MSNFAGLIVLVVADAPETDAAQELLPFIKDDAVKALLVEVEREVRWKERARVLAVVANACLWDDQMIERIKNLVVRSYLAEKLRGVASLDSPVVDLTRADA